MKDPREKLHDDFEVDECDECDGGDDDKAAYARPVLDGDNEEYYGFGYDYDEPFPLFVDGLEMDQFLQQVEDNQNYLQAFRRRQRKEEDNDE